MDDTLRSPRLTVEVVVFSLVEEQLCILMVKQESNLQQGWTLPQGEIYPEIDNKLEQTAKRTIKALLNVETPYLEQVQTVGNNVRDHRGWSVSVVYYSLICAQEIPLNKTNDLTLKWMRVTEALDSNLPFDHQQLIENCYHRLQNKSLYTSLPIFLLAEEFTLTELQKTYELVLGIKMEKKSFRRRLLDASFLQETGRSRHANHRPALLYRLSERQPYYFARIIEGVRDSKNIE